MPGLSTILSLLSGLFKVFNFFTEKLKAEENRNQGRLEQSARDRAEVDKAEAGAQTTRKQSEGMTDEELDKDLTS